MMAFSHRVGRISCKYKGQPKAEVNAHMMNLLRVEQEKG